MRRGIALALVLMAAVGTAPLLLALPGRARARWQTTVCRSVLRAVGIRVEVRGPRRFTDRGALVVANHVSWIEVLALPAVQPVRLIAKREVRRWPVVGAIAGAAGVMFIDRGDLRRLPATVAEITAALRAGAAVVAFPEGTTWCGAAAGPFRRAAFQAAVDAGVAVRPVAVVLRRDGRPAPEAAFVGELDLFTSVARVLRLPRLVCELTVLPALAPDTDRAELAARAGRTVARATGVVHPGRPAATPAAPPVRVPPAVAA